jgi:two-component system, OmpR family, response regulator
LRVLLAEDDSGLARQITLAMQRAGYTIDATTDGEEAWFLGDTEPYDAVILDLGLPQMDGLAVLRRWRQEGRTMPVLILTARSSWREKVTGLREGADDYLGKPFEMEELIARLEALIRRASGHASAIITVASLALDPSAQRITLEGQPLDLTALEYRALAYLMMQRGKVVSKAELTDHLYGHDDDRDSNVIEVLINRLRKKLRDAGLIAHSSESRADLIQTRRGHGYELSEA